jgi:XTP/dITP diphosphohydrolase
LSIPTPWVLATHNRGKAREFEALLAPYGVQVEVLTGDADLVEERGPTYLANALAKAQAAAQRTGRPALADDSGIEVDALGGRPGLHSARYAGGEPHNLVRILEELISVPWPGRTARMRAVVVLAVPEGRWWAGEGVLEGRMAMAPRGTHGFGYDPGFELSDGRTLAQLTLREKNAISHRRRAVDALFGNKALRS